MSPRKLLRLARLYVLLACALLGHMVWQTALIEIVDLHEATEAPCSDDEGPCDCGDNCHCCLACAHQTTPTLVPDPVPSPVTLQVLQELDAFVNLAVPCSREWGPPPKVPKLLA